MQDVWTVAVGALLGAWFAASVLNQAPPDWWMRVKRFGHFSLVPRWTFFAPQPGRYDQHLLYRDIADGVAGPWVQVNSGDFRPVGRCVFNPTRFRQKALLDLVNRLRVGQNEFARFGLDARSMQLSAGYVALLAWVTGQPAPVRPCLRQFAIARTAGHGAGRTLQLQFVSAAHPLEQDDDGG